MVGLPPCIFVLGFPVVGVEERMDTAWLTAALAEYNALNQEILQRNTELFSVVIACIAGGITLIGLVYKDSIKRLPAMIAGLCLISMLGITLLVIRSDTMFAWSRLCEIEAYVNSKTENSNPRFPLSWQREHGIGVRPWFSWFKTPKPNYSGLSPTPPP
jgi:hypothetical protein